MKNFPSNINRIQLVDDLKTVYYLVNKNRRIKSSLTFSFTAKRSHVCNGRIANRSIIMGPNAITVIAIVSSRREKDQCLENRSRHVAGDNCRKESDGLLFLISNRPSLCKGQPLFKRWLITLTLLKYRHAIILTLYYISFFQKIDKQVHAQF